MASRHIRKLVCNFLIATVLMTAPAFASTTAEYSRTETFSAVRLTYGDMASMISRIHQFVTTANVIVPFDKYYREEATIRGSLSQVRLKDFSSGAFADAPEEAYSIHYLYFRDTAPISRVDIYLGDNTREVAVEGSSSDQVAALLSLLSEDLHNRETHVGGMLFRIISGGALLIFASIAPLINPTSQTKATRIALLVSCPLIVVATWILPWDKWFPGTAIYSANASFLVRNSALISVIGTVASLLALLFPLLRTILRQGQTEKETSQKSKKSAKT